MSSDDTTRLPDPPEGREGWPWTSESERWPPAAPSGRPWPRVSVVTPSFNQGRFVEQTIRSVLLQGCPDLEYVVVDGGSTDESVAVVRKYEAHLAHWVSERDRGQSHAINKGLARASGEVLCWLNSDDYYLPGTLRAVSEAVDAGADAVVADGDGVTALEHARRSGYDEIARTLAAAGARR